MAINFAAEHMQGYNYPRLSVLAAATDSNNNLISYPTYDDVAHMLASGVLPVITLRQPDGANTVVESLLYYGGRVNDTLIFGLGTTQLMYTQGQSKPELTIQA